MHPPLHSARAPVALAAAIVAMLAWTAVDQWRARLAPDPAERLTQPTAIEDRSPLELPRPLARGTPLLKFGGLDLRAAADAPEKRDPAKMFRLGTDDTGKTSVYRSGRPEDGDARFVRVDDDKFLKVE
jgi:hypothetical protein